MGIDAPLVSRLFRESPTIDVAISSLAKEKSISLEKSLMLFADEISKVKELTRDDFSKLVQLESKLIGKSPEVAEKIYKLALGLFLQEGQISAIEEEAKSENQSRTSKVTLGEIENTHLWALKYLELLPKQNSPNEGMVKCCLTLASIAQEYEILQLLAKFPEDEREHIIAKLVDFEKGIETHEEILLHLIAIGFLPKKNRSKQHIEKWIEVLRENPLDENKEAIEACLLLPQDEATPEKFEEIAKFFRERSHSERGMVLDAIIYLDPKDRNQSLTALQGSGISTLNLRAIFSFLAKHDSSIMIRVKEHLLREVGSQDATRAFEVANTILGNQELFRSLVDQKDWEPFLTEIKKAWIDKKTTLLTMRGPKLEELKEMKEMLEFVLKSQSIDRKIIILTKAAPLLDRLADRPTELALILLPFRNIKTEEIDDVVEKVIYVIDRIPHQTEEVGRGIASLITMISSLPRDKRSIVIAIEEQIKKHPRAFQNRTGSKTARIIGFLSGQFSLFGSLQDPYVRKSIPIEEFSDIFEKASPILERLSGTYELGTILKIVGLIPKNRRSIAVEIEKAICAAPSFFKDQASDNVTAKIIYEIASTPPPNEIRPDSIKGMFENAMPVLQRIADLKKEEFMIGLIPLDDERTMSILKACGSPLPQKREVILEIEKQIKRAPLEFRERMDASVTAMMIEGFNSKEEVEEAFNLVMPSLVNFPDIRFPYLVLLTTMLDPEYRNAQGIEALVFRLLGFGVIEIFTQAHADVSLLTKTVMSGGMDHKFYIRASGKLALMSPDQRKFVVRCTQLINQGEERLRAYELLKEFSGRLPPYQQELILNFMQCFAPNDRMDVLDAVNVLSEDIAEPRITSEALCAMLQKNELRKRTYDYLLDLLNSPVQESFGDQLGAQRVKMAQIVVANPTFFSLDGTSSAENPLWVKAKEIIATSS